MNYQHFLLKSSIVDLGKTYISLGFTTGTAWCPLFKDPYHTIDASVTVATPLHCPRHTADLHHEVQHSSSGSAALSLFPAERQLYGGNTSHDLILHKTAICLFVWSEDALHILQQRVSYSVLQESRWPLLLAGWNEYWLEVVCSYVHIRQLTISLSSRCAYRSPVLLRCDWVPE